MGCANQNHIRHGGSLAIGHEDTTCDIRPKPSVEFFNYRKKPASLALKYRGLERISSDDVFVTHVAHRRAESVTFENLIG